jgi:hypothetical protein
MSLNEFWTNVCRGAGPIVPPVVADSPRFDRQSIESALRRATLWLTPRAVDGFDESDFPFLGDVERVRLSKLVSDFRDAAAKVSPTTPAAPDVAGRGLHLFAEIVEMLELDRYGDADAYKLGKEIERALRPYQPAALAELRFNSGLDHTGDPALWIWAFLSEEVSSNDDTFLRAARELREILRNIARRAAPDRWPYISFRPISEPIEAVEA